MSVEGFDQDQRTIALVAGPFVGEEGVVSLEADRLQQFQPETARHLKQEVIEELGNKAYGIFKIDTDTTGYLLEKTRPYSRMYDLMLALVDNDSESRFIRSITDLSSQELQRTLQIGKDILSIYEDHAKTPLLTTISFNFHDNPLSQRELKQAREALASELDQPGFGQTEIKTDSQFFAFAHPHFTAIELSKIQPTPLSDEAISRRDALNAFDPTMLLIEEVLDIPSIQAKLTQDLTVLKGMRPTPTGIVFETQGELDSIQFAQELQVVQSRFATLYTEMSSLFINHQVPDRAHMPSVALERFQRIHDYINHLYEKPENASNVKALNSLKRHLTLLAKHLVSADDPAVLAGEKPLFMKGFADTITIFKSTEDTNWQVIFSPRILSTGNMLASRGLVRQKPETGQAPTPEWFSERADVLSRVATYAETYSSDR